MPLAGGLHGGLAYPQLDGWLVENERMYSGLSISTHGPLVGEVLQCYCGTKKSLHYQDGGVFEYFSLNSM